MTSSEALPRYAHFINGQSVPPSSGEYLPTEDPVHRPSLGDGGARQRGRRRAPRSRPRRPRFSSRSVAGDDARRSGAARCGGSATSSSRNAERLAEIERRDNGKLASRSDRPGPLHGRLFPLLRRPRRQDRERRHPDRQEGRLRLHEVRAEGRGRDHHAVELAADADQLEARAGAGRRLHRGHQAVRIHLGLDGRVRGAVRRGGLPDRRRQRRHRPRPEVGEPLVTHPRRRACRLHRRRRGRAQDLRARRARPEDGHAGARRQVAQHRVRRRRSRPGGERRGLGHLRRVGPDLPGRLAPAGAGIDPRRLRRAADRLRQRAPSSATRRLPDTQIGPIATRPQFEKILSYIEIAKAEGATCVLGGKARPDLGAGQFIEPTIFTGVDNDMRIAQEEVFGPVLSVIPFKDEAGRDPHRQRRRFGLAAGGVDAEPAPRDAAHRQAEGRHRLGQQLPRDQLHVAVRRLQAVRDRPRVRAPTRSRNTCEIKTVWISTDLDVPTLSSGAERSHDRHAARTASASST